MAHAYIKKEQIYTYRHYRSWPEDRRCELIDGVAHLMSPAPNRRHQEILLEIAYILKGFFEEKPCHVYIAPFDVRLPEGDEIDDEIVTVVQPDIVVVCDESKLDDNGMRGAPDWILEIVSPFSAKRDKRTKLRLYERHRVPEYWIIEPDDTLLTIRRFRNGRYGKPEVLSGTDKAQSALFPELMIDLADVFRDKTHHESGYA